jgi:hypothetical protein
MAAAANHSASCSGGVIDGSARDDCHSNSTPVLNWANTSIDGQASNTVTP